MPVELFKLNMQLQNLHILYEDAIDRNTSIEELKKLKHEIEVTEMLIQNRKKLIQREQSSN
jgi:hypothetical protein